MVNAVTQDVEQQGHKVSCQKGCGACCRQMVPVSGVEARYLADLVEALPEPRRSEIRGRFDEARRRLAESGLLEKMRHNDQWTDDDYQAMGVDYFRQAIACPFLEEESCSIHPQRPVSCREYLVTSPAEHCALPRNENVRTIAFPFKMWWCCAVRSLAGRHARRALGALDPGAGVGRDTSRRRCRCAPDRSC